MKYKDFELTDFQRQPGMWRVAIKRVGGAAMKYRETTLSEFVTHGDTATPEQSMQEAKNLIDNGMLR